MRHAGAVAQLVEAALYGRGYGSSPAAPAILFVVWTILLTA